MELSLSSWVAIPLIFLLVALPGGLIVRRLLPAAQSWNLPLLFAALVAGLAVVGWLGIVLAEFGWFGRWTFLVVWAVVVGGLYVWNVLPRRTGQPEWGAVSTTPTPMLVGQPLARWEWLVLAVWLVAAGWLFFRPHEYILGAADAGVYISLGAEIANHGGFRLTDETLASLNESLRAAVLRPLPNTPGASSYLLPGFYITDAASGAVTPQFYPLHPVLQAVAFALTPGGAAGIGAELLLTGLWMLLASVAVYLHARDIGGSHAAVLVLAALSVTALQVWFARYPTSEALTQLLLWSGLWAGGRWLSGEWPQRLWALVAGLALGMVFLLRIDSIVLLPVLAVVLVWRWVNGWRAADTWFAVPLVGLFIHSVLHGAILSAPYFYETLGYAVILLERLWPLWVVLAVAGVVVLGMLRRWRGRLQRIDQFQRPLLAVLIGAVLLYALYGWLVRPGLGETIMRADVFSGGEIPVTNHENWLRLGWYLTPLGVWLGVAGSCLLLWRVERRTVLTLAVGFLFAGLYLWNISANPHHVYVMRRYVPAVVPFITVAAAYLLSQGFSPPAEWPAFLRRLPRHTMPALSAAAALIWLGGLAWAGRSFITQVDHAGLTAQVDALAARLPAGAVLVFNDQTAVSQGDVWGTPLKYIYGFDVFTLRRDDIDPGTMADALIVWHNNDRPVVWVGDPALLDAQGLDYRTEAVAIRTQRLEGSYTHKPERVLPSDVTLLLHFIE